MTARLKHELATNDSAPKLAIIMHIIPGWGISGVLFCQSWALEVASLPLLFASWNWVLF